MASSFLLLVLMFLIGGSVISSTSLDLFNSQDLVTHACNQTLHKDVCESSLRSDPRSRTSDLQGLAFISLDITLVNAKEIVSQLNNELKSNGNASNLSKSLKECVEEYSEAIANLEDSVDALRNKDYESVNTLVTAAMTDSDTCELGFKDMPTADRAPHTIRPQYFFNLCSNALVITHLGV